MENYHKTYNNMYQYGLKYKTKSRTISLSMYGSTIGATRYPQFIKDDEYKILPRPYHTSKPGNKGWKLIQTFEILNLIKHIEAITFQYFNQIYPDRKKQRVILYMIQKAKEVIPSSCQIGETFFTHMPLIGNLSTNGDLVSKHVDKDDFITVLFHLGEPLHGGGTDYYTGLTRDEYGFLAKHIPCEHGRLTIGCFDKIIHRGEPWEGSPGCFNLNLKKKVLEHFLRYGMKYYSQYERNNYPSGPFFSC